MPEENEETSAEGASGAAASSAKTFDQEAVNALVGKTRDEARRAAEKSLLEGLGITDIEAAKATLKAVADRNEAEKSELQKATEANASLQRERDQAVLEAQSVRKLGGLEGALRDAGITVGRVSAALKLADLDGIEVEGRTLKGVEDVVAAIKAEAPEWFPTGATGARQTAPDASSASSSVATGGATQEEIDAMTPKDRQAYIRKTYGVR